MASEALNNLSHMPRTSRLEMTFENTIFSQPCRPHGQAQARLAFVVTCSVNCLIPHQINTCQCHNWNAMLASILDLSPELLEPLKRAYICSSVLH